MAKRFRLDFSTAYGQLILLVFLPISLLAMVGGVLVLYDTSRAGRIIQKASADTLLNQSQTLLAGWYNELAVIEQNVANDKNRQSQKTPPQTLSKDELNNKQNTLSQKLQFGINDRHLQGLMVINEQGDVLLHFGETYPLQVKNKDLSVNQIFLNNLQKSMSKRQFSQNFYPQYGQNYLGYTIDYLTAQNHYVIDTGDGTFYSKPLMLNAKNHNFGKMWLIVNVDNEPLKIARYQVILALAITGLFTILLLLLSINIYARRWITPIYEMRLHLQRTNAENLYKPMAIESSGEINQLQQDLVKTLRRLHSSFQELKNHADQTEDDLRQTFDEMEMQNISMRNAHDAAISANRTKSAFLANISHELRTPLNSIDGFINLLSRHGGLNHEQDLYVQTIRKSSAHLLALVNDVLDFSKIEAGKLVLEKHEFDLYATIYDVVDMLSPIAAEKGLRLAVYFYDDVPRYLLGDALRVKQVLTNLVNNAIKFTDTGEVIVRASLDETSDNNVKISITDTGRGIDTAHQKVLFQSFSQGDPSITRQYGGTGLGLVISKQLTQLMGGTIGFYDHQSTNDSSNNHSNDNDVAHAKGSTFWFSLPIDMNEQQAKINELPMKELWEISVNLTHSNEKPLQILVWIEHLASLQILRGSLRQLNVHIDTVNSLNTLLDALNQHKQYDWLLIDNGLSADTTALLKQIRLHYAGKLALFGYHVNLDPDLLKRYQVHSLYQPLDRRQLYQLLNNNQSSKPQETPPQKWQGFCVLAVDDHVPNLLVLEALLQELGVSVVSLNSGFDAIEYMRNSLKLNANPDKAYQHIDLIFMDIQMPKMSGRQASQQIRQLEHLANEQFGTTCQTPIIALTAHSLSDEREKLLASGINDYVGKPISQPQLIKVLEHWLANNQSHKTSLTLQPTDDNAIDDNATDAVLDDDENPLLVIDWQDALTRVAGKADLASNLLNLIIESSTQEKAELTQAWQDNNREAIANIAHRILGASRYTGVPQLRHASQQLEDKCLLNVDNNSPTQFIWLQPYFEQLITALDNLISVDFDDYPMLKNHKTDDPKENDMAWKMM
nr:ATP-binding protein [uncultured Moraxella sp.]